jgi:hypothetical protein
MVRVFLHLGTWYAAAAAGALGLGTPTADVVSS